MWATKPEEMSKDNETKINDLRKQIRAKIKENTPTQSHESALMDFIDSGTVFEYVLSHPIKADYTPRDLISMLEDVVTALNLSDAMLEIHAPADLVRLVLEQKDLQIRALKAGMKDVSDLKKIT